MSWPEAAELGGCPVPTIDWWSRQGRIENRPFAVQYDAGAYGEFLAGKAPALKEQPPRASQSARQRVFHSPHRPIVEVRVDGTRCVGRAARAG